MKKMFMVLATILICSASFFVACSDKDDDSSVAPGGNTPEVPEEPTTDLLEVKVTADMPTAVLSSFSDNSMGSALVKRVSKTTSAIDSDTKLVLFKGDDIMSFSNEDWMNMGRVYLNGGYVAIERATNRQMLAFAVVLGLAAGMAQDEIMEENDVEIINGNPSSAPQSITNELQRRIANASSLTRTSSDPIEEELDVIGCEMLIISQEKCYSQVPYNAEETAPTAIKDEEGHVTTIETKIYNLLNPYHYGLLADGAAAYLNQAEKDKPEPVDEAPALTRAGVEQAMNDALNCSDEYIIAHSIRAYSYTGEDVIRENMATTTIRSWSAHDFATKQDFYFVEDNMVVRMGGQSDNYNSTLYWGPYDMNKWHIPNSVIFKINGDDYHRYYGSWLRTIKHSMQLIGKGSISLEASLPSTDNSTQSQTITVGTTDTTSETSGWNIGLSAGKGGGLSFGYSSSTTTTHTNSFSMSTTQVNNALKVTRNTVDTKVTFEYMASNEPVVLDWNGPTHSMAADILTNDCEINNSVCWKVKNPSDSYQLYFSSGHYTSCLVVRDLWVFDSKKSFLLHPGMTFENKYDLKQPCRYMGTWNCDISIKGKNSVANASRLFRQYLQDAVAKIPFTNMFNVAEMHDGETDVMSNLIATVSSKMKKGTQKRKMIDNHAKELGIESYTITWFPEDPDIKQEFMLSGEIK